VTSKSFRAQLERRAIRARVAIPDDAIESLETYVRLLARWNQKVNLTALSVDTPTDSTIDRLLIEPLAAAARVDDSWTPWLDVGSGGGSPAIPLKIVKRGLDLTMVESKTRKAAFLREVVRELKLTSATVETARFEEFSTRASGIAGLVTVRAIRLASSLTSAIRTVLRPNGHLLIFTSTPAHEPLTGFGEATCLRLVDSAIQQSWLEDFVRS